MAAGFLFSRADTDQDGSITASPDLVRVFHYFDLNGQFGTGRLCARSCGCLWCVWVGYVCLRACQCGVCVRDRVDVCGVCVYVGYVCLRVCECGVCVRACR